MERKDFWGINHGKGKIVLPKPTHVMRPVEVHLKEDGSLSDEPSIAIVMESTILTVAGEISVEMFNLGLADIGYKIVKL